MDGLYLIRIKTSSCNPSYHVRRLNMGEITKEKIKKSCLYLFKLRPAARSEKI